MEVNQRASIYRPHLHVLSQWYWLQQELINLRKPEQNVMVGRVIGTPKDQCINHRLLEPRKQASRVIEVRIDWCQRKVLTKRANEDSC